MVVEHRVNLVADRVIGRQQRAPTGTIENVDAPHVRDGEDFILELSERKRSFLFVRCFQDRCLLNIDRLFYLRGPGAGIDPGETPLVGPQAMIEEEMPLGVVEIKVAPLPGWGQDAKPHVKIPCPK